MKGWAAHPAWAAVYVKGAASGQFWDLILGAATTNGYGQTAAILAGTLAT